MCVWLRQSESDKKYLKAQPSLFHIALCAKILFLWLNFLSSICVAAGSALEATAWGQGISTSF